MPVAYDDFLSTKDAAARIGVPHRTLERWRGTWRVGFAGSYKGPEPTKFPDRSVLYDPCVLDAWKLRRDEEELRTSEKRLRRTGIKEGWFKPSVCVDGKPDCVEIPEERIKARVAPFSPIPEEYTGREVLPFEYSFWTDEERAAFGRGQVPMLTRDGGKFYKP